MKQRGSSIAGSDEVENGINRPEITGCQTANIFVPLGPWATGNDHAYLVFNLTPVVHVGSTPEETASLIEQGTLMADNARVRIFINNVQGPYLIAMDEGIRQCTFPFV